jgi:hypothetical protein
LIEQPAQLGVGHFPIESKFVVKKLNPNILVQCECEKYHHDACKMPPYKYSIFVRRWQMYNFSKKPCFSLFYQIWQIFTTFDKKMYVVFVP